MLADWKEKELEDAIAQDPALLLDVSMETTGHDRKDCRLLGQQITCQTGIIDLLFTYGRQLYIVEVKAITATERTIGQVVRYKEAMKYAIERALLTYAGDFWQVANIEPPDPVCVVIAPSFTREAINTLATMGWSIVARRDEGGVFRLSKADHFVFNDSSNSILIPLLKDYALTVLAVEKEIERRRNGGGLS